MHQTRKGKQWFHRCARLRLRYESAYRRRRRKQFDPFAADTTANLHDLTPAPELLQPDASVASNA